jgi:hypothetical protein
MEDDIRFNCILVAESLPADEPQTGRILHGYIKGILDDLEMPVQASHVAIGGVNDFSRLIDGLTVQATQVGLLPILHIEAHGSENAGLVFADESLLSWPAFCEMITPLNRATRLKLVVVVAACYGADLLSGVRLSKAAPCFAFIAPTREIDVGEVMGRFRDLYRAMLTTLDAQRTFDAMNSQRLESGVLVPQTAQHWFELLMRKYLREQVTPKYLKEMAMRQYLTARSLGDSVDMRALKREFRRELPNVIRTYFSEYFMLNVPGNKDRFAPVWKQIAIEVERAVGRHDGQRHRNKFA